MSAVIATGLTEAQVKGKWDVMDASEDRRRALLPTTPAPEWDELMISPAYMRAMDLMP